MPINKDFPNYTKISPTINILEQGEGPNRHERRTEIAIKRLQPERDRLNKIRQNLYQQKLESSASRMLKLEKQHENTK